MLEFLTYIYPCQNHSWVGVSFWSNDTIKNSHVKFNSTKNQNYFKIKEKFCEYYGMSFCLANIVYKCSTGICVLLLTILWTDPNTNTFKINHQNKKITIWILFILHVVIFLAYFVISNLSSLWLHISLFFYPMVMNILVYEQPYGHNMHKTTPCCQAVANLLTRIDTLKFCYIDKLLIFSCTGSTQKPT